MSVLISIIASYLPQIKQVAILNSVILLQSLKFDHEKYQFLQLKIIEHMDEYQLSHSQQKYLMAQHYHSSLDEPNLDNVEAKLYATRRRNHELAQQYFKNKYGSTKQYDNFVQTHNMGVVQEPVDPAQDLRKYLERKARQIQRTETEKYKGQRSLGNNFIEEQEPRTYSSNKPKESKKNPWKQEPKTENKTDKKKQVKIRQEDNEYVIQKASIKKQGSEFISDFKKYLSNKKYQKSQIEENSYSPNKSVELEKSGIKKQTKKVVVNESLEGKKRNYEEELVKKIFADLGQLSSKSKVEKLVLLQYLMTNKKILKVLGISDKQLSNKLLVEHETVEQSLITFHEVLFFVLKAVGKASQINSIKENIRDKSIPDGCMLEQGTINYFQSLFKKEDENCDLIINRLRYISKLASDPTIKKLLNLPAVYEAELDRSVSLRRVFQRIQMEAIVGSEEQKKIKQYISWAQFLDYFRSGYHDRSKYDLMILVESLTNQEKFGIDIPEKVSQIIGASFKRLDKGGEYFNIYDALQEIVKHPEYQHEKFTLLRQGVEGNLNAQTFEELLTRIKENTKQYMTIKEFLQYFTLRGKPIEEYQEVESSKIKKNFSGVKIKEVEEDHVNTKNYQIDGYDSDPELYSSQLFVNKSLKKIKDTKKVETSKSFYVEEINHEINKKQFKVTIPQPFLFQEREKNRKGGILSRSRANSQNQIKHSGFKAKKVPQKVKDKSLYDRMLQQDEQRIKERKQNSMIMTLASERPFSFLNRKAKKKNKEQREEFVFKAKPIPWYCSVDLLKKKKEVQISRNQKIAKEAQQSLAKAKLPPRMERDYQQKIAKNAQTNKQKLWIIKDKEIQEPKFYRKPPDFQQIHKKFEESMERKRKENKVTQPKAFKFSENQSKRSKTANKTTMNIIETTLKQHNNQSFKKIFQSKQSAPMTLKFEQQAVKRRNQMEQKRKKQEKIKREAEERLKIDEELKKNLALKIKKQQQENRQSLEEQKNNFAKDVKKNVELIKQCVKKGREQPLLVQRPLKRDQKFDQMKKLFQISEILKQNGIKEKQHDAYFKKQELILIQDFKILNSGTKGKMQQAFFKREKSVNQS